MKYTIPYGNEKVQFEIPDGLYTEIAEPAAVKGADDVERLINEALDNPIGSGRPEDFIRSENTVNIICDDYTRPTPCHLILPPLLERLKDIGVKKENIKIVMALGSHRYMTEEEMRLKVGDFVFNNYRVVNSEFKREEDLVYMGKSDDGVDILVSAQAIDSDIRIGIGNIVPHPAMGFSGGCKILFPGVTGEVTVAAFHVEAAISDKNMFGMEECPVRLKVEPWAEKIGLDFIINTVLTPEMEIYKVVAGHYIDAHRKGVEYTKEVFGIKVKKKADIVISSSFPADMDFWQSGKGICSAEHGLRDKGTIILVSPNYEGMGPHDEYGRFFGMEDAKQELLKMRKTGTFDGDPLALAVGTAMSELKKRVKEIVVVGDGLTDEDTDMCGIKNYPLSRIQEAIDDAIADYEDPAIIIATHGGDSFII